MRNRSPRLAGWPARLFAILGLSVSTPPLCQSSRMAKFSCFTACTVYWACWACCTLVGVMTVSVTEVAAGRPLSYVAVPAVPAVPPSADASSGAARVVEDVVDGRRGDHDDEDEGNEDVRRLRKGASIQRLSSWPTDWDSATHGDRGDAGDALQPLARRLGVLRSGLGSSSAPRSAASGASDDLLRLRPHQDRDGEHSEALFGPAGPRSALGSAWPLRPWSGYGAWLDRDLLPDGQWRRFPVYRGSSVGRRPLYRGYRQLEDDDRGNNVNGEVQDDNQPTQFSLMPDEDLSLPRGPPRSPYSSAGGARL